MVRRRSPSDDDEEKGTTSSFSSLLVTPLCSFSRADGDNEEGEEDDTDFSEDPGDRYIVEQLGIVLNAGGGDPLAAWLG